MNASMATQIQRSTDLDVHAVTHDLRFLVCPAFASAQASVFVAHCQLDSGLRPTASPVVLHPGSPAQCKASANHSQGISSRGRVNDLPIASGTCPSSAGHCRHASTERDSQTKLVQPQKCNPWLAWRGCADLSSHARQSLPRTSRALP